MTPQLIPGTRGLLMVLGLLIGLLPSTSAAEVHISVVDGEGSPGEAAVPVEIDFANPDDAVAGFQFNLLYDPLVLSYASHEPSVRIADYSVFSSDDPGDLMLLAVELSGLTPVPDGPEPLLTVYFDVDPDAPTGIHQLVLDGVTISSPGGTEVAAGVSNGVFEVLGEPGDDDDDSTGDDDDSAGDDDDDATGDDDDSVGDDDDDSAGDDDDDSTGDDDDSAGDDDDDSTGDDDDATGDDDDATGDDDDDATGDDDDSAGDDDDDSTGDDDLPLPADREGEGCSCSSMTGLPFAPYGPFLFGFLILGACRRRVAMATTA